MEQTQTHSQKTTSTPSIADLVSRTRERFDTGMTRSLRWRLAQLDGLARFLVERESEIYDALAADVGKPRFEAYLAEIGYMKTDIEHTKKHLREWAAPQEVPTPMVVQPGKSEIHKDPLGVVLIIAPWNYPFQLMMAPLVGAIAAGNCAVLKPSEVAPATSALFAKFIPRYVDPDCFPVVEGAVKETTELLHEQFDHIFYTGNGSVGRIVMAAAAKHLTPVTLELGGKSPVIVDSTADLDITAKRIVWAKFVNAGQTCVAPDYILVEDRVHDALVHRMVACIREFYGDDPQQSPDFARVVNARHHQRLMKLLGAGEIVAGGKGDEADRYIAPTIIKDVPEDAPVMQDEIFGPILPVLSVPSVDAAMAFINRRPKPLALYLFSSDERTHERVLKRTTSGGVTINHGWLHLGVPDLPFGGVGESGMGAYHGKRSFDVFSHQKAVLRKGTRVDPPVMYPPYSEWKQKLVALLA